MKYVALIPAYKPSAFLSELLKELQSYGFENVLVDDGSGIEYEHIFFESSRYGEVLYHAQNAGKGTALKTGLAYIATHFPKDAMLVCMLLSAFASGKVKTTFAKYDKVGCRSGVTGYDAVARLMRANGVNGISIGCVKGSLTDHYHPTKSIVNLSESTYGSNSVAAVAVAAHEMVIHETKMAPNGAIFIFRYSHRLETGVLTPI